MQPGGVEDVGLAGQGGAEKGDRQRGAPGSLSGAGGTSFPPPTPSCARQVPHFLGT